MIIPLFLLLCVFLLVLNVFTDFNFTSPKRVKRKRFWGLADQGNWLKRTKMTQHGRIPRSKMKQQEAAEDKMKSSWARHRYGLAVVDAAERVGYQHQLVVAGTTVVAPLPLGCSVLFTTVRLPCISNALQPWFEQ